MIGKSLLRIVSLAVMGALALVMGSQLLSSVALAVVAFRYGDFVPVLSTVVLTIILMRVAGMADSERPLSAILSALGWAATVYLTALVVILLFPQGLVLSLFLGGLTAITMSTIKEPEDILTRLQSLREMSTGVTKSLQNNTESFDPLELLNRPTDKTVFYIPEDMIPTLIEVLRTFPALALSVTKWEEFYTGICSQEVAPFVRTTLEREGIVGLRVASTLHARTTVNLPLIEIEHGMALTDYRIVRNQRDIDHLLSDWPVRGTLFGSFDGLRMIVRLESSFGLGLEPLPRGKERRIIVDRDYSSILAGGRQ